MAKSQRDESAHSILKDFIYRIHRFIKIRRLKRRLSKTSLATNYKRESLYKHERAQSLNSNRPVGIGHHVSQKETDVDLKSDNDDDDADTSSMTKTATLASPRKTKSLNVMPNLSTPSSSKRWRIGVMRSLDLSSRSLSAVGGSPGHGSNTQKTGRAQLNIKLNTNGSSNTSVLLRNPASKSRLLSTNYVQLNKNGCNDEEATNHQMPDKAKDALESAQSTSQLHSWPPAAVLLPEAPSSKAKWPLIEGSRIGTVSSRFDKRYANMSQASSIHIHRIGISRLLRTTSNFSYSDQSGGYASDDSRLHHWNQSSSRFGSEDVPMSWGQVLDQGDDVASSSVYSSSQASPRMSIDEGLALPSLNLVVSNLHAPSSADGPADPSPQYIEAPSFSPPPLPTVSSTSSLGKQSLFREELDLSTQVDGTESPMKNQARRASQSGELLLCPVRTINEALQRPRLDVVDPQLASADDLIRPSISLQVPEPVVLASNNAKTFVDDSAAASSVPVSPAFLGLFQDLRSARERRKSAMSLMTDNNKRTSTSSQVVSRLEVPRLEADTSPGCDSRRASAASLLAKAIQATEAERSAFLLPQNKDQAKIARVRDRSSSYCPPPSSNMPANDQDATVEYEPTRRELMPSAMVLKDPEHKNDFNTDEVLIKDNERLIILRPQMNVKKVPFDATTSRPQGDLSRQALRHSWPASNDFSFEPVGAWGRYPSHTRQSRSGSAGATDRVIIRDFAFEIDPKMIVDGEQAAGDSGNGSPRKPRIGLPRTGPMQKAREVLRNYRLFLASPNVEYLKYGHGRRTSVDQGGEVLDDPDLEAIPNVTIPVPRAEVSAPPMVFNVGRGRSTFETMRARQQSMAISVADSMLSPGTSVYHKPLVMDNLLDQIDGQADKIEAPTSILEHSLEPSGAHQRNESIMSIRQSSYDLLQKLQESEASERQKAMSA